MKNQIRKAISLVLVIVQLFVLFPILQPQAKAAQSEPEVPVLNKTIVGTVQFQAFNFLGENTTGTGRNNYSDGKDYTSTFYYTDDYFASSAINANADETTELWSDLDNTQLAACSAAFALASFTTNIGNVTSNTEYSGKGTWENTNYANKDANVRSFLSQCEFPHVETFGLNEKPTIDSIGYTIGHKTIHVWDEESKTNKDYTLVAVGVRGAGYDSEWANNVTIGNPHSTSHEMPGGRHWGFDDAAKTVCTAIQLYLDRNGIAGDVKYWITGFSRAAAVANLAAGSISDSPSVYHTSARQQYGNPDVYAYTLECPQAASVNEPALNYRNIHNIINPMDAVPKVSPTAFQHQRLGVDYQMPYYKNMPNQGTTSSDKALNKTYYERMQAVLGTIATAKKADGSADPVVTAVANYPYNTTVPVYTITGLKLISDAAGGNLMNNFGTEEVSARNVKIGNVYMDQFIDNLIDVFLTSKAWSGGTGQGARPTDNLNTFINEYQADFRALLGYLLGYSGPAYLGMADQLVDAVGDQIGSISLTNWWNNTGFALAFARFYLFNSGKDNLISRSQDMMVNIVNNMTADYPNSANGSGITRARMNTALRNAVKLVINLYAQEKTAYDSQYFGTSLHWLREILCTHMQETVLSWIMSLDSNHMNRSCRTIMIPTDCNAKLLEFRPEYADYDGSPEDADAAAPAVAEWENGAFITKKDARISSGPAGSVGYTVIRYPASLNIRVDITSDTDLPLANIGVDDYQTTSETINVSAGENQYNGVPSRSTAGQKGFNYVTTNPNESNANAANTALASGGTLEAGDTLHVIANPTEKFDDYMEYRLLIDKAPKSVVAEYTMKTKLAENVTSLSADTDPESFSIENGSLIWTGAPTAAGGKTYSYLGAGKAFEEYDLSAITNSMTAKASNPNGIETRHSVTVTPAANIYYDDTLLESPQTANAVSGVPDYQSVIQSVEAALAEDGGTQIGESNLVAFKFTGTRIDLYLNTTAQSSSVIAYLLDENGVRYNQGDGTITGQIVNPSSQNELYNVPAVSFRGLNRGTYTLAVAAPANQTYTLDGVRVYDESKADYLSVREVLIDTADWTGDGEVSGSVYLDSIGQSTDPDQYEKSGPKGELYLQSGNGVAFAIEDYDASASYRIGLSAVTGTPASVQINAGAPFTVSTTTHMFYDLQPTNEGYVVIKNAGGGILSVTDIEAVAPVRALRLMASPELMRFAVSLNAAEAPAETAEPTPDLGALIQQLISSFVESLFSSISRLFAF